MNIPFPMASLTGIACAALAITAARGETAPPFRLITLDPGHFHAALVQKRMFPSVSPEVNIYAPDGPDLTLHLARVESFNKRKDDPTAWKSTVHTGPDFLQRKLAEKPGNIIVLAGKRMAITPAEFMRSTKIERIPDFLDPYKDAAGDINIPFNGEFTFVLKGIHAKVSVIWNYEAPAGAGDTHFSLLRGGKVSAIIRQGAEQGYKPVLYLEPRKGVDPSSLESSLEKSLSAAAAIWPGVAVEKSTAGWTVVIPQKYHVGHEAHFGQVAEKFLGYLKRGDMPSWEVPNILAKYRTIMDAYTMSRH